MLNVYDLNANWLRLDDLLEESGGEITPEIEALEKELITESKESLEQAGQYRSWIQSQVAICKERRSALAATAERMEAKLDRVDAALVRILQALGKPQRFAEFTLSTVTRTNQSFTVKPNACIAELPEKFVRWTEPTLNIVALKAALKDQSIPEHVAVEETTSTSVMQRKSAKKEATEEAAS